MRLNFRACVHAKKKTNRREEKRREEKNHVHSISFIGNTYCIIIFCGEGDLLLSPLYVFRLPIRRPCTICTDGREHEICLEESGREEID